MNNKILKDSGRLLASIAVCQAAGFFGAFFTAPAIDSWYKGLEKPAITPPNWLFGPVWITLYTLMGISLFLIWRSGREANIKPAVAVFGVQLGLNALWSFLFFGLESPVLGLAGIIALIIAVVITIVMFFRISLSASVLLVPYLIWVTCAAVLNFLIYKLN